MKKVTLFLYFLISLSYSHGQVWKPYGLGFNPPNVIFDLINYNNDLYACGGITGSGSTPIKAVARWDGTNWNPVGSGTVKIGPKCMREFNGDLIVAGSFSASGTLPNTKGIARWDGTQWNSLRSGITSGTIYGMAVYHGSLYVGGNTTLIDSMSIRDIARWDGNNWFPVCTLSLGLSELRTMEVFNNELYIGGYFVTVNGVVIYNIAKFDGTTWSPVGGGLNGDVIDLYNDTINNRLYACGGFSSANSGTIPCPSNVAYWDGNTWHAVGPNGPSLAPSEIYVHNNEVYIGNNIGYCFNSNGDTLSGIAKWDGNDWMPLDRGVHMQDSLDGSVFSFLTFKNDLVVGGIFTTAGNTSANLIAAWGDSITSLPQQIVSEKLFELYPNPTSTKLEINISSKVKNTFQLIIIDATGKTVMQNEYFFNSSHIVLNLPEELNNGVYTCQIRNKDFQYSENFVLQH